jgi:hypothetical protein
MGQNMKDIIKKLKSMGMGFILGLMDLGMKDNGSKIAFVGMEFIRGLMEGSMKGNGLIIICMGKEFIAGKMEENMKENISMIKNMDLVLILGLIKEFIQGNGLMESIYLFIFFIFFYLCNYGYLFLDKMEKENIFYLMEKLKLDYGKMVKELNG